jgi:hypothetical protein
MARKDLCEACGRTVNARQLKGFKTGGQRMCARCRGKIGIESFERTASPRKSDYTEELRRYADCMEEIKRRTDVIRWIIKREKTTGYIHTDVETACLQMRKILELIALSSLIANNEEYSRQYQKFAEHWHATKILEDIEAINPDFWPVPSEQVIDPNTGMVKDVVPVTKEYLTHENLVEIYDECNQFLHAQNPYGAPQNITRITSKMALWLTKMMNLLNHHQIRLVNPDFEIWVLIRDKDDNRVKTFLMKKIPLVVGER